MCACWCGGGLSPAAGVAHAAAAPWPAGIPAPASSLPGAGSSLLRTARPSACLLAPARGPLQTPAATAPPPPPPPDLARSTRRFWSVILPFTLASPVGIFVGLIISDVAQGVGAASISALASGACCAVLRPHNAAGRRRWGGGALSPLGCTRAMRCVLDRRTVHTARALQLLACMPRQASARPPAERAALGLCPRRYVSVRGLYGSHPPGAARPAPRAPEAGGAGPRVLPHVHPGRLGLTQPAEQTTPWRRRGPELGVVRPGPSPSRARRGPKPLR